MNIFLILLELKTFMIYSKPVLVKNLKFFRRFGIRVRAFLKLKNVLIPIATGYKQYTYINCY